MLNQGRYLIAILLVSTILTTIFVPPFGIVVGLASSIALLGGAILMKDSTRQFAIGGIACLAIAVLSAGLYFVLSADGSSTSGDNSPPVTIQPSP